MFKKKSKLKRMIKASKRAIEALEKKRTRSQAALLEALINGVEPYPADVEYFKTYTALIQVERENITKLFEQLRPDIVDAEVDQEETGQEDSQEDNQVVKK